MFLQAKPPPNKGQMQHVVQGCCNYNITFQKLEIHTVKMRPVPAWYTSDRGAHKGFGPRLLHCYVPGILPVDIVPGNCCTKGGVETLFLAPGAPENPNFTKTSVGILICTGHKPLKPKTK